MAALDQTIIPCAICETTHQIEHHHVVYRSRGGGDEASNLIPLCHDHHQMFTDERWRLNQLPDGGFEVVETGTGKQVCRNLGIDNEVTRKYLEGLWMIQRAMTSLRDQIPGFTNEQLRSAWDALQTIEGDVKHCQMAVLHTAWERAPYGDRIEIVESIGQMFGISKSTAYDFIRAYENFRDRLPTTRANTSLLIAATRSPAVGKFGSAERALDFIEARQADRPNYSVRDFRRDLIDEDVTGDPEPPPLPVVIPSPVIHHSSGRTVYARCQFCHRDGDMEVLDQSETRRPARVG